MTKRSKRYRKNIEGLNLEKAYTLSEAIEILKNTTTAKYDESIELNLKTGVDPKKADQQVRGTVALPHGTGKTIRLVVLTKGDKVQEALEAGADEAGADELVEKIQGGWTGFDALVVTPDMMREVGKLGKLLGPRGLMPSPKAGTVTTDVAKAVKEIKAGKVEYKVDKSANINIAIGKISFTNEQIADNAKALLGAIYRAKPASVKGAYWQSLHITSTLGPGLKLDENNIATVI
ncbi:MAG: 50S ribosomal protein L1 [Chlamydiia bacterium]|nr:50S ribosomal protein L1 [Chlamydiia bacterium]